LLTDSKQLFGFRSEHIFSLSLKIAIGQLSKSRRESKHASSVMPSLAKTSIIISEKTQDKKIMVTFDVKSLFTDVPIQGAAQAARRKLECDPGLADRTY